MKHHYMKWNDVVPTIGKEQITLSFSFLTNKFLSFSIFKMSAKKNFVEKLQRQSRKILLKLKEKKQEKEREQQNITKYFAFAI